MSRDRGFFRELFADFLGRALLVLFIGLLLFGAGTAGLMIGYDLPFAVAVALVAIGIGGVAAFFAVVHFFNN